MFWVVGHFLNEAVGWRQTLALFALINLLVCLPLNWFGPARREAARTGGSAPEAAVADRDGAPLEGRLRSIALV